ETPVYSQKHPKTCSPQAPHLRCILAIEKKLPLPFQTSKQVGEGGARSLSSPLTHAVGKKPEEAHPVSKSEKKRTAGPDQRGPTKKERKMFAWKHHGRRASVPSLPAVSLGNRRLDPHTRLFVKYSPNLTDCECRDAKEKEETILTATPFLAGCLPASLPTTPRETFPHVLFKII
ncbi:hypothetical protein GH733_014437, partial [Mirounga leonina]